jgi:hypothetical protein
VSLTVNDLIERLQQLPPDHLVVMSKDAEGNGYSPLADVTGPDDPHVYEPETTWSGEVYKNPDTTGWTEEQIEKFEEEWGGPPSDTAIPCVILDPTN